MHFKVAVSNFHVLVQAGNSLTDVSVHYQHVDLLTSVCASALKLNVIMRGLMDNIDFWNALDRITHLFNEP